MALTTGTSRVEMKKQSWYEMVEEDERLENLARLKMEGKRQGEKTDNEVTVIHDDANVDPDEGQAKRRRTSH